MGLFVALLNEELVREKRTMRNYKTAVVGTGECEIICAGRLCRMSRSQNQCGKQKFSCKNTRFMVS